MVFTIRAFLLWMSSRVEATVNVGIMETFFTKEVLHDS